MGRSSMIRGTDFNLIDYSGADGIGFGFGFGVGVGVGVGFRLDT